MIIKVIAEASLESELKAGKWGLSFLVGDDLLFDTFSEPDTLRCNLNKLNVDIRKIRYVVISHEHWDHTGGLWWFLQENNNVTVFVLSHFSDAIKTRVKEYGCRVIEVDASRQIKDTLFTTGEIRGTYNNRTIYEQSLIIKEQKLTIITGCSHPGLLTIIDHVASRFTGKIGLIAGGFHLNDKTEIEINNIIHDNLFVDKVKKIAPCHCTGEKAIGIFLEKIPAQVIQINTGTIIDTKYI